MLKFMKTLLISLCWWAVETLAFAQGIEVPNPVRTNGGPVPTMEFTASLTGAKEIPANSSPYKGFGAFTLTGNLLVYEVGLPLPTLTPAGAGIYGPATTGMSGDLILLWTNYIIVPGQPNSRFYGGLEFLGNYSLTPEQAAQLKAGLWYVNIKSASFPEGEIRSQICPLTPDADCDGDGVPNKDDLCPDTPPGAVVDGSGCSIDELVPCSAPWRNHREYVKEVKSQAFRFWREQRLTAQERNAIVKQAEESQCGNPPPPRVPTPGPIFGPGSIQGGP